jgi:hypothetical protein
MTITLFTRDSLSGILYSRLRRLAIVVAVLICFFPGRPLATDYLTTSEIAAISGSSLSLAWLSHELRDLDTNRTPLMKGVLPFEASIQRFIGGECRPGKRNFLDDRPGSVYTPVAFGVILTTSNLSWPQADRSKDMSQDLFLYVTGLTATKGITHTAKAIFSRPRPYVLLGPTSQPIRHGFHDDRSSFFSGHTSSAFFAATYLNLRLRVTMRSELSGSNYDNWRWAPPSLLFGWASFVGLSRIHAYKHYLSDVLLGALTGYLIGELFFSFAEDDSVWNSGSDGNRTLVRLRFSF